jgi:hypothetical protein
MQISCRPSGPRHIKSTIPLLGHTGAGSSQDCGPLRPVGCICVLGTNRVHGLLTVRAGVLFKYARQVSSASLGAVSDM